MFARAMLGLTVFAIASTDIWVPRVHAASVSTGRTGIEDLHRRDQAATLSGDPHALADLWTKYAVRMEPGGPAEVSRAALVAVDSREWKLLPKGAGTLTYRPDIRDVQIHDDWAVEWGYVDSTYRVSAKSNPIALHGKLLRVLHRDADGKWRFSHVMWNDASPRRS